ncbi:hypothetical protein D187_010133 [Cystobacter fuscus DSM 2262]|uniref:Uncharacterized protein n=1 Tax=Cystobacter fuscus (strain ATCC 25194 / DSM 2262 / NBRC 100088 / M29) TaxID=1242864 RepID=S9QJQ4_CYSF2|nr:hypothetical protein D187_010133 [Cystobacter fuscus DSM 2262]
MLPQHLAVGTPPPPLQGGQKARIGRDVQIDLREHPRLLSTRPNSPASLLKRGRPGQGCAPRGCTVPCTGAARGLASPGSGPSRPLRSSPHPQHGFYPAYTLPAVMELYQRAFHQAVQAGDFQIACFCGLFITLVQFFSGIELAEVSREMAARLDFTRKAGFQQPENMLRVSQAFVEQMRGRTASFESLKEPAPEGDVHGQDVAVLHARAGTQGARRLGLGGPARFLRPAPGLRRPGLTEPGCTPPCIRCTRADRVHEAAPGAVEWRRSVVSGTRTRCDLGRKKSGRTAWSSRQAPCTGGGLSLPFRSQPRCDCSPCSSRSSPLQPPPSRPTPRPSSAATARSGTGRRRRSACTGTRTTSASRGCRRSSSTAGRASSSSTAHCPSPRSASRRACAPWALRCAT